MKDLFLKFRFLFSALLIMLLTITGIAHAGGYPLTIQALQERYADEITAHAKYNAYAQQACAEGYPNIAHLFKALASSEAVHGSNFKRVLKKLGSKPWGGLGGGDTAAGSTRSNLKQAATVERDEIDKTYPDLLDKIKQENHEEAIRNITYAWKAEKQHRELIVKLQKASSSFFGLLVKRIEGKDSHIHICQVCGSTLLEKPAGKCPICGRPASKYREVAPFPEGSCPVKQ